VPLRYIEAIHGWLKNASSRTPVASASATVTIVCRRRVSRFCTERTVPITVAYSPTLSRAIVDTFDRSMYRRG
jgi:hypothetical protein